MLSRGSRFSEAAQRLVEELVRDVQPRNSLCFSARTCALTTSFRTLGGMSDALSARNSS